MSPFTLFFLMFIIASCSKLPIQEVASTEKKPFDPLGFSPGFEPNNLRIDLLRQSYQPKSVKDIDYRVFAKTLIAGPIASLIYGINCLLIFLKFDTLFNSFFGLTSLTSLGLFLATTIPNKSGIMYTDRKRYQRLNKKGETRDAEIALYQIISQSIIENSFKNVDLSKTDIIEKDDEVEMKFWAEYIRYLYNKDNAQENESVSSKSKLLDFKSFIGENVWRTLKIE